MPSWICSLRRIHSQRPPSRSAFDSFPEWQLFMHFEMALSHGGDLCFLAQGQSQQICVSHCVSASPETGFSLPKPVCSQISPSITSLWTRINQFNYYSAARMRFVASSRIKHSMSYAFTLFPLVMAALNNKESLVFNVITLETWSDQTAAWG